MASTLSKVYTSIENSEFDFDIFLGQKQIYRVYCASVYNLIKAILESKEFFVNTKDYKIFNEKINTEFILENAEYCSSKNCRESLFKIIETIRNQVNHSLKDEDDNNVLFEAYIDFNILEDIRLVIKNMIEEVYNCFDKKIVKNVIISKPTARYISDKYSEQLNNLEKKIDASRKRGKLLDDKLTKIMGLFRKIMDTNNIFDLLSNNLDAIKEFEDTDSEIQVTFEDIERHIYLLGSDFDKEALILCKNFIDNIDGSSIKQINQQLSVLSNQLNDLKEKYDIK